MTVDKAAVEEQIREILRVEREAMSLSDKLFSPHGLFNQIATTEPERRDVARSELFREAQRRFSDLQRQEAAEFASKIRQLPTLAAHKLLKLERS